MKNILRILAFFLLLCVISLITSCVSNDIQPAVGPEFNQKILLENASCDGPCWHGLVIGESTEIKTMDVLSTLEFINQKSIDIDDSSVPDLNPENWVAGKNIFVACPNHLGTCLRLTIANEILRDIFIELEYGLTVDVVIQHFGDPDYIGYMNMGGEVIDCTIELIWHKKQLAMYSTVFSKPEDVDDYCLASSKNGMVNSNLFIVDARYMTLPDINLRIERGELYDQLIEYIGVK